MNTPICGPSCWERVECKHHGILMPPRGRSGGDMPTCDHQHERVNTAHLWGPHDSSRFYSDPVGWEQHVDGCTECRQDFRGEEPDEVTP